MAPKRPTLRQRLTRRLHALSGKRTVVEILPGGIASTCIKVERGKVQVLSHAHSAASEDALRRGGVHAARAALASQALARGQEVAVSLPRHLAIVKWLTLPSAPDAELREMVSFQAEKRIPFPLKRVALAFQKCGTTPDGQQRVILVAVENSVVEAHEKALEEAGLQPRCLTVSSLAAARAVIDWDARLSDASTMLVRLAGRTVEIDLLEQRQHRFGRAAALSEVETDREAWLQRVVAEIKRTETAYRSQGGAACTELIAYGPRADEPELLARLAELLGRRCRPFQARSLEQASSQLPVPLGMFRPGCADLLTGMRPTPQRSRLPWLVALAAVLLLALGLNFYNQLQTVEAEVAQLESQYTVASAGAKSYREAERAITSVRAWNAGRATATEIMHALASRLPSKVFVRHLSYVDGAGLSLDATSTDPDTPNEVPGLLTADPRILAARTENQATNERGGKAVFDFNLELELR